MPIRHSPVAEASRRGAMQLDALIRELRLARLNACLSQRSVAKALSVSRPLVGAWEARRIVPDPVQLHAWGAVVGLDVSIRAFPGGSPLRDVGQLRLLARFRVAVGESWTWRAEVPVTADPRDRRAFDAVLSRGTRRVAIEAISRLSDSQAQTRPVALKLEASGVKCAVLVLADTRQ
ncbi:MAG: helix-turn-helix domain-containing protein, partial [Chloroflexota bacterium]|nr:helix-turn-helix domain-containing protein [Chloroflexota bacterium]